MRKTTLVWVAIAIAFLAIVLVHSCTSDTNGGNGGSGPDGAVNPGKDAGPVGGDGGGTNGDGGGGHDGGGKKDGGGGVITGCVARDQECAPDQVCDFEHGSCVPGKSCPNGVSNCAYFYPDTPDAFYCDSVGKVCKRRLMICEPCSTDEECGENKSEGGNEDRCIDYPDGKRCGKACGTLRCPAGFECAPVNPPGTGANPNQCRPMRPTQADPFSCAGVTPCQTSADCPDPNRPKCYIYNEGAVFGVCASYCESDNDCPFDPKTGVATVCNPDTGSCVPGCVRPDGTMDDVKCASPKVCHTNGKCGSACGTDTDCSNMFGTDVGWVCDGGKCNFCLKKNPDGTCAEKGCLNDGQCPFPGYCDRATHACSDGCRDEHDCNSGYDCTNSVCVKKNCLQNGGAQISCEIFQFCCGEGTSSANTCKDPSGGQVDQGACYTASTPPWCTPCKEDKDCPGDAGFNDWCVPFPDGDGGTDGGFCGLPCTLPDAGMSPLPGECPRGHECRQPVDQNGKPAGPPTCYWARCATWYQDAGVPADGGVPEDAGAGGDL